jgi:hypothetical protein
MQTITVKDTLYDRLKSRAIAEGLSIEIWLEKQFPREIPDPIEARRDAGEVKEQLDKLKALKASAGHYGGTADFDRGSIYL